MTDLNAMTYADLKKLAKSYSIKGYQTMKKTVLIAELSIRDEFWKAPKAAVLAGEKTGLVMTDAPAVIPMKLEKPRKVNTKEVGRGITVSHTETLLKDLCDELNIDTKAARRTLRTIFGAKSREWIFTAEECKKIRAAQSFKALA